VTIRVLIVDDNPVIRSGLAALVDSAPDLTVVGQGATGREAIDRTDELAPDVVLLDVRMPVMDGVTAAGPLSERATVLMLTYTEDRDAVAGALRNGASGYLVHGQFSPDDLLRAIRDVAASRPALSPTVVPMLLQELRDGAAADAPTLGLRAGGHDLTPREAEVMDTIAAGLSNGQIAEKLFLAPKTVKNTINRIYVKLGVTSRGEAIARWVGTAAD
jgi:DNA-binding NarL/FixJ family response regulator